MSRTIRKPYTKSKAFDKSCRCHGGCEYCLSNRQHKHRKQKEKARDLLEEWNRQKDEEEELEVGYGSE